MSATWFLYRRGISVHVFCMLIICLIWATTSVNCYEHDDELVQFTLGNVSECQQDLRETLLAPNVSNDSIRALDAFGKPGSGILVGDLAWLGTYQECQDIPDFHYCLVDLNITTSANMSKTGKTTVILPRWGTCFPKSCKEKDIMAVLGAGYIRVEELNATPRKVQCSDPLNMWSDGVFVFTFIICCLLGTLMLLGYAIDVFVRQCTNEKPLTNPSNSHSNGIHVATQSTEETPLIKGEGTGSKSLINRLLLCFAFNRNLSKLLDTKQNERSILCLNGIRVISISWVILGHTFVQVLPTQSVDNALVFGTITKQFGFQAVLNAPYSVDTFFLLSGLLVTVGCLNRLEKNNGKLPWLWFYFHRFWRLTPVLGFIILVTMTQKYFGEGPVWFPYMDNMASHCQKYWWTTLLYINNFYPTRFTEQCVGVTWYLSNDMQFFVIGPVFILVLYKFKKFGLVSLVIGCLISFSISIGLIVKNNFDMVTGLIGIANQANGNPNLGGADFTTVVYQKPYCRIPVYFVGMGMGFLLHHHRRIRMPKILAVCGWLLATLIAMLVVYGLYPAVNDNRVLTTAGNALYGALARCAWGVSVSWVIFACYFGYGGPIDTFLSWKAWIPLSRLTYTTYLIHQPVIFQFYLAHKVPWHMDLTELSYCFVAITGLAYTVAMLISMAIEYPFANMEKLFLPSSLQSNRRVNKKDDDIRKGDV